MIRKVLVVLVAATALAGGATPAIAAPEDPGCVELLGWSTCMPRP